jgi:hypothetical protein
MARRGAYGPPLYPTVPLRGAGSLGRYLWPALILGAFAALAAFVAASDGRPGMSDRGALTVLLAAVVAGVLHAHRGQGARHLAWVMCEYAVVALLAVLLVTSGAHEPPAKRGKRAASRDRDRPAVARVIQAPGNALDWIADRWQAATEQADREAGSAPPPSTRPRR